MANLYIICIEDQPEVLDAISKDLSPFEELCIIEECESAAEALPLMEDIEAAGDHVAVIVSDHVMPGQSGIDLLIQINKDARFTSTKKLLLTGLATHQDTIKAINEAGIDQYLEKPWKPAELVSKTKNLLTRYILEKGIDYQQYISILDTDALFAKLKRET